MDETHPGLAEEWEVPFEPIKITGIIVDDVGKPPPGSSLYSIPFSLSAKSSYHWAGRVDHHWRRPAQADLRGRPQLTVDEGVLTLRATRIQDVEQRLLAYLKVAVDAANEDEQRHRAEMKRQADVKEASVESQRQELRDAIERLDFS